MLRKRCFRSDAHPPEGKGILALEFPIQANRVNPCRRDPDIAIAQPMRSRHIPFHALVHCVDRSHVGDAVPLAGRLVVLVNFAVSFRVSWWNSVHRKNRCLCPLNMGGAVLLIVDEHASWDS